MLGFITDDLVHAFKKQESLLQKSLTGLPSLAFTSTSKKLFSITFADSRQAKSIIEIKKEITFTRKFQITITPVFPIDRNEFNG